LLHPRLVRPIRTVEPPAGRKEGAAMRTRCRPTALWVMRLTAPTASVAHATTPRPLLESTVAAFDTRKRCHAWDVGTQSSPLPSLRGGEENASSSSIFPAVPASHMTRVPSQPGRVHFCPRVVTPRGRARSPPLLHSPTWAPGPMISPVYSAFLGRTRRPLRTLTAVTCPKGLAPVNAV
jgi:hypothetical protein